MDYNLFYMYLGTTKKGSKTHFKCNLPGISGYYLNLTSLSQDPDLICHLDGVKKNYQ